MGDIAIKLVIDYLQGSRIRSAADILTRHDNNLAFTRRDIADSRMRGKMRFGCGCCGNELNVAQGPGRPHFKHRFPAPECPWYRDESDLKDARAAKYQGRKESEEHRILEARLLALLRLDDRFSNSRLEEIIIDPETGLRRRPDVSTVYLGDDIFFECQVSAIFFRDVDYRARFGRIHGRWLVWLFNDVVSLERFSSFREIMALQKGNAFVLDEHAFSTSLERGRLTLKVCSVSFSGTRQLRIELVDFSNFSRDDRLLSLYFHDHISEEARARSQKYKAEIDLIVSQLPFGLGTEWERLEKASSVIIKAAGSSIKTISELKMILVVGISLRASLLEPAFGYKSVSNDIYWAIDRVISVRPEWSEAVWSLIKVYHSEVYEICKQFPGRKKALAKLRMNLARSNEHGGYLQQQDREVNALLRMFFPEAASYLTD